MPVHSVHGSFVANSSVHSEPTHVTIVKRFSFENRQLHFPAAVLFATSICVLSCRAEVNPNIGRLLPICFHRHLS